MGGHWLHIQLHLSYLQYYWDDQPVWKPIFQWEQVARLPRGPVFWLLLPLTKAPPDQRPHIMRALEERARDLSLPGCEMDEVVRLLTNYLTPAGGELQVQQMVRREIEGVQYSFQVYEDGTLRCYSQHDRTQCNYARYESTQKAVEQGFEWMASIRELYQSTPMLPENRLPDALHIKRYAAPPTRLEGPGQVTAKQVAHWVDVFLTQDLTKPGCIVRLELSWGDRAAAPGSETAANSLVLLGSASKCMALYFQGKGYLIVLGSVGQPDLYKASGEHPMGSFQGKPIPEYFIHPDRVRLTSQVHELLRQIGASGVTDPLNSSRQWSFMPVRDNDPLAFSRARREWGGFEDEAARNPLNGKLELADCPDWLYTAKQAGEAVLEKGAEVSRELLEMRLAALFNGQAHMLQMGWNAAEGPLCSILLLRQEQRYLMLFRDLKKDSGDFWVGDRRGYLNADKKIRRIDFCGQKVEFYLLHESPQTIRDGLDLLLPNIRRPDLAMKNFGEWSFRKGPELAALPDLWQPPGDAFPQP